MVNTSPGNSKHNFSGSIKKQALVKNAELEAINENLKNQLESSQKDYQNLIQTYSQKIAFLETSGGNLIASAQKLANLIPNSTTEEEFSLRLFENDRRAFENYIKKLREYS